MTGGVRLCDRRSRASESTSVPGPALLTPIERGICPRTQKKKKKKKKKKKVTAVREAGRG
ncbi:MAG TPA: hypothetical protein DHW14_03965 [Clostridiales bacterium]|nr:hypothetical protein [Clostridiales bacterium]